MEESEFVGGSNGAEGNLIKKSVSKLVNQVSMNILISKLTVKREK